MVLSLKIPTTLKLRKNQRQLKLLSTIIKLIRFYQQLWLDVSELFAQFINSIDPLNLQDMDDNIKNQWVGNKKNN